jgi:hypothetical protein
MMGITVGALREILDGTDDDEAAVYIEGMELIEVRHTDNGLYLVSQDTIDDEDEDEDDLA